MPAILPFPTGRNLVRPVRLDGAAAAEARSEGAVIMDRKKIAVLFGGCSSEYSVSLCSAAAVIRQIDGGKYDVVMLGITRQGEWYRYRGTPEAVENDAWLTEGERTRAVISPDRSVHGLLEWTGGKTATERLDAAFPVLHGRNGEDGTVQGLLELAGIPVIGCGALSSALCMDKDLAHRVASLAGVRVPRSVLLGPADRGKAGAAAKDLPFPVFVKPLRAGSSFGISRVETLDGLERAVEKAFDHDDRVLIEEGIEGFEVGCAVLGDEELTTGDIDEIELAGGFFDFEEKYNLITSRIHVPARVDDVTAARIRRTGKTLYRALGCRGFARVDMFLTPDGEVVFNEVNTIPGMTPHSRYPNMMKGAGLTFGQVLDALIGPAVGR